MISSIPLILLLGGVLLIIIGLHLTTSPAARQTAALYLRQVNIFILPTFLFSNTTFIAIASLLLYGLFISKREFRFYPSKAYFMNALNKEDIFKQMNYFVLGLQEYNKYLQRHLKHRIRDLDKIFSKVSLLDSYEKTKLISLLSNSFETEIDKLKPLKLISSEFMPMKPEDIQSFLVPESLKSRLKVVGAFLAALVPIVISILALLHELHYI